MLYCPSCGDRSLVTSAQPTTQFTCQSCDFTFYQNSAAAVMVALCCDDEVLIAIRGREPGEGMWDLPGGFVDPDESLEQAVIRELYEELNIRVDGAQYVCSNPNTYPYKGVTYKTCDAFFTLELDHKPAMQAQDDVAGFQWVKLSELEDERFAFESARMAMGALRAIKKMS